MIKPNLSLENYSLNFNKSKICLRGDLPATKFFFASKLVRHGSVKRQFGKAMKELCEMSTLSSRVHSTISSGKVDIRLLDKFSSEIKEDSQDQDLVYKTS